MNVLSRAHRVLKRLERYVDLSGGHILPARAPELPRLSLDERPVGIYFNDPVQFSDTVFITTAGIYVHRSDRWDHVPYQAIDRALAPESKQEVSGLKLLLLDRKKFWLPITGVKSGRFYDAFEVLRFISRVLADTRASTTTAR
jgi:hypothetical protein